jgi:hypothetical protein
MFQKKSVGIMNIYMNIWGVGVYSHIHIYEYTPRPPIIASSYGPGPKLNEWGIDPAIEVYCSKLEERVSAINTGGINYSNLSVEEIKALKILKSYNDIIIKRTKVLQLSYTLYAIIIIIVMKIVQDLTNHDSH